jgi:uncharacterized protein (DUF4415 family)
VSEIKVVPAKEEPARVEPDSKAAKRLPSVYGHDRAAPEALAEFAAAARENRKNRRNPSPVVAIRLMPDVLAKYKSLGKGYTGIMADILNYAADNPEFLKLAAR